MGAWYVTARYNTAKGLMTTTDGPFCRRSGPTDSCDEAETFAMHLKNTIDHPEVWWSDSEQASVAKKQVRHEVYAHSGDITDIPARQYSATKRQGAPAEFPTEEG